MENKETYNGWTNYETWRVNLEMCDFDMEEITDIIENYASDVSDMMDYLKQHVGDILEGEANGDFDSFSYNYASAFTARVNFHEIANHLFDSYYEDQKYKESIEYAKSQPTKCWR